MLFSLVLMFPYLDTQAQTFNINMDVVNVDTGSTFVSKSCSCSAPLQTPTICECEIDIVQENCCWGQTQCGGTGSGVPGEYEFHQK